MSGEEDITEKHRHPHSLPPGTFLDHENYRIEEVLGEGGFGTTYRGMDLNLRTPVAIKEYGRQNYGNGLEAFQREAQMLSGMRHIEGIVKVYNFFWENHTAYFVMDYVDGISLQEYVRQEGTIAPDTVLKMMRRPIMALQMMHKTGLIHRDISADNLMVSTDGRLILIDFGVARYASTLDGQTHTVFYKPGFSALELYSSKKKQGPWTDVYSICATMYYMMSGVCPVSAPDRVFEDSLVPLADLEGIGVSDELSDVIRKGMALYHRDRIQNMTQLYKYLYKEELPGNAGDFLAGRRKSAIDGHTEKSERRTMYSRLLSLTRVKHELDDIEGRRKRRKNLFVAKVTGMIFVLFLTGAVCLTVWKRTPQGKAGEGETDPQATATPQSTPDPQLAGTAAPTGRPTPKPTKKPTPGPTRKPTKKPTSRPTQKPASGSSSAGEREKGMIPLPEEEEGLDGDLEDLE